ncbi:MAG: carboxypeptidase regulatory-like domain-containing protein [Planctomycetes bacterium]|nr:carboxypeptidase regulatory-like domain-containing protein [Planctomycetota bacterium]
MSTSSTPNRTPLYLLLLAGAAVVAAAVYFTMGGGPKTDNVVTVAGDTKTASAPSGDSSVVAEPTKTPIDTALRSEAKPSSVEQSAQAPLPAAFLKSLSGLSGRVVEPDGTAVKGAPVELIGGLLDIFSVNLQTILFDQDSFEPKIICEKQKTGEDGRFHFKRVDPRLYYLIGVNLGQGRPYIKFIDHTPNPAESVDLGDIKLDPPFALTGRVVNDQGGKPVANARVRAWTIPNIAFQAGIANINPEMSLLFKPTPKYGMQIWRMPKWIRDLYDKLPFPSATTGADGTFKIEGVPACEITLVVESAGRPPSHQRVPQSSGAQKDVGDIVANSGTDVEGTIVDEHDAPLPNAEVMVGSPSPLAPKEVAFLRKPIHTNAKGQFSAAGVGGKQIILVARAEGMTDWESSPLIDLTGDDVKMKIPAPRSVILTVLDEAGKPGVLARAAASRMLDGPGMFPQLFPPLQIKPAMTEPGKYKISGLRIGEYAIYAESPGFAIGRVQAEIPEEPGDVSVTLQLEREIAVPVTVYGMENGARVPLEAATVGFMNARGRDLEKEGFYSISNTRTDARGVAHVRALKAGDYVVQASHPGYAISGAKMNIPTDKDREIVLTHGGTIDGKLTKNGKLVAEPHLIIVSTHGIGRAEDPLFILPKMIINNSDGAFKVSHLPPGNYRVELSMMRMGDKNLATIGTSFFEFGMWEEPTRVEVEVKDDEVAACTLEIERKAREAGAEDGRIHGVITLNGAAFANAPVMVYGAEYKRLKTDDAGRFDTGPIKANDWIQINVSDTGSGRGFSGQLANKTIKLKPGEDRTVDINIRTGGPLTGVVRSSVTNDVLPGAQVQISKIQPPRNPQDGKQQDPGDFDNTYLHAMTDDKGEFEIKNPPEGNYTVRASAPGHANYQGPAIPIATGVAAEPLNITLNAGVKVAGKIVLEGERKFSWAGLSFNSAEPNKSSGGEWAQLDNDKLTFSIDSLTPGRYRVILNGWGATVTESGGESYDSSTQYDPVEITVPAAGLKDVQLAFKVSVRLNKPPAPVPAGEGDKER